MKIAKGAKKTSKLAVGAYVTIRSMQEDANRPIGRLTEILKKAPAGLSKDRIVHVVFLDESLWGDDYLTMSEIVIEKTPPTSTLVSYKKAKIPKVSPHKYTTEEARERYAKAFDLMNDICNDQGWGDPSSYARGKEIHMAALLGHRIADTYTGEDAFLPNGEGAEYKTTTTKEINGSYNGLSIKATWDDEVKYLTEKLTVICPHHYIARYDGGTIVELWYLTGTDVLRLLLPSIKKAFDKKGLTKTGQRKVDARLSGTLRRKMIYANGKRIQ